MKGEGGGQSKGGGPHNWHDTPSTVLMTLAKKLGSVYSLRLVRSLVDAQSHSTSQPVMLSGSGCL